MTVVIEELDIDWAPFEALLDERPCSICSEKATWLKKLLCCCNLTWPQCNTHKEADITNLSTYKNYRLVTWHCEACGARGRVPGARVFDLVKWVPLS